GRPRGRSPGAGRGVRFLRPPRAPGPCGASRPRDRQGRSRRGPGLGAIAGQPALPELPATGRLAGREPPEAAGTARENGNGNGKVIMPTYTQDKRLLAVNSSLGKDVLLLRAFSGREEMSRLFRYQLELLSEKDAITAPEIVGQGITFS